MPDLARRLACAAGSLLLGLAVGVAAAATHRLWWGLLLAVAVTVALLLALPAGWWARLPYGVGYAALVFVVTTPRPEGDYLVASDLDGYLLIATGIVALMTGLLTLPRVRRGQPGSARPGS